MALNTPSRSALHPVLAATTTSADFSLHHSVSAFQPQDEISPGKNAHLHRTIAGSTPLRLDHESFAVLCPLALLGSAFYPILVHRLAVYAPRFLPTLGRPHAVALHFVRCDQLTAGLSPAGMRPCWAHKPKSQSSRLAFLWERGCGLFFQFTQPIGSDGIGFRHSLGCGCNLLGWERRKVSTIIPLCEIHPPRSTSC